MSPFFSALPFAPFLPFGAALTPMQLALRQQMQGVDQLVYGSALLSESERRMVAQGEAKAGSIWVVRPSGDAKHSLVFHDDVAALRAMPGRPVARFAIAGGAGSDWGAVALARVLADHYGEPVGGIVAGYEARDALSDMMGGLMALHAMNLGLHLHHLAQREAEALTSSSRGTEVTPSARAEARDHARVRAASGVLVELLQDQNHPVRSIAGHSKGALALSFALDALLLSGDQETLERVCGVDLLSVGVLLMLPPVISHVTQCLGELDGFGAANSDLSRPHHQIAGAGHHLNTDLPCALDLAQFLKEQQL